MTQDSRLKNIINYKNNHVVFWLLLFIFSIPVSFVLIHDVDIWWHMQTGRVYLETFGRPDFSTFYFTPVNEYSQAARYTWLGDIIFYLTYLAGGDVGLQLFRMIIIFGACYLIVQMGGGKTGGWRLLALMFLIIGTYQTQLIRNALFSYLAVPLLFYIWYIYRYQRKRKIVWLYPVILGIWGCLHGSYLLGLALLILILSGDCIDLFLEQKKQKEKNIGIVKTVVLYFSIIVLSFAVNMVGNPQTKSYFSSSTLKRFLFFDEITNKTDVIKESDAGTAFKNEDQTPPPPVFERDYGDGALNRVKEALNNTLFNVKHAKLLSGDFASPFDSLQRPYVVVGLFIGLLGAVFLCFFIRPLSFSMIFPFLGGLVLGCGYVRMVGYIPLIVMSLLFISSGQNRISLCWNDFFGAVCAVVFCVLVYVNYAAGFRINIGTGLHVVGLGRVPLYSDKCADWIMMHYKNTNTFTTILNGGYLLFRWYPEKKVFADGFFDPHSADVMNSYYKIGEFKSPPDFLFNEFGVNTAVVGLNEGEIMKSFFHSMNWFPICIDRGMVAFLYQPDENIEIPIPEIVEDVDDLINLPKIYRKLAAIGLYYIKECLLYKGYIKNAHLFENKNSELLEKMSMFAPNGLVTYTNEKFVNLVKDYGLVNDKILFWEEQHNQAILSGDLNLVIENGQTVVKKYPERFPVYYNMAVSHLERNELSSALVCLKKMEASQIKDPSFWKAYKKKNFFIYKKLYLEFKEKNRFEDAFYCLSKAFLIADSGISDVELFKEGLFMYDGLKKAGKPIDAFRLVKELHFLLPEQGRILNAMAWHILTSPHPKEETLLTAKEYALEAVNLLEKRKDPTIDMAYDTLAEVYFRLGDIMEVRKYEKKAIESSPIERKGDYNRRSLKGSVL